MISVSVGEAKNKLPHFLHLVEEKHEEIQITRYGKVIAFINGKEKSEKMDKKAKFLSGIDAWRKKNADWLFNSTEIDSIFAREKDDDFSIRHPEDFE